MRTKRLAAGILAIAACLAGTAGCGSSSKGSDSASGGGELKVWLTTQEDSQGTTWKTLVDDFEKANPGITVKTEQRSIDAHKEALRQVSGTNAGPDVYWYWEGPGLGGALVKAGMSKDLTEYYKKYSWDGRFSKAAVDSMTQYGGYHGVPWTLQGQAIFYNKKLFAQAGITEPPKDYATLVADADKLAAKGITPIEFGGAVNWHLMRLLDNLIETKCGAETRDKLFKKEASWTDTACVGRAFTEMKTWVDKYVNKGFISMSNDDSSQLFYQGKAAMALEGTWFDANTKDKGMDPSDIGIVQFPTGTQRLYGFGEGFYISNGSKNADNAAKFLDFITNDAEQAKAVGTWAALSVNKNVKPKGTNPLDALWSPIFEGSKGTFVNSDQALSLEETTEYWRIQNAVAIGQMQPSDAGRAMQSFFDSHK